MKPEPVSEQRNRIHYEKKSNQEKCMKTRQSIALLASGLLLAGSASAQETLLEHVVNACADDLEQHCSDVTPGEGRLMYCVAAYQDQLSGQCEFALYEAASLLRDLTAAIVYVAQNCETEINTLCADVEAGQGRILSCLDENADKLGDACKQTMTDAAAE
jgi:Cysteine rich repeat